MNGNQSKPQEQPETAIDTTTTIAAEPVPDDAWLNSIKLRADHAASIDRRPLEVPLRRPNKEQFFRVHPENRLDVMFAELKSERESFIVLGAEVESVLIELITPARLFQCVTRQGDSIIWPAKLPVDGGRRDAWRETALLAAEAAEENWIRVHANMPLGAYAIARALEDLGDPKWPAMSFAELLKVALRDRIVDSMDHPLVRQHLGLR